jgi:peptidyl-prolyl cis-trans isomerase SurA
MKLKIFLLLSICSYLLIGGQPSVAEPLTQILVTINNESITAYDLEKYKKILLFKLPADTNLPPAETLKAQLLEQIILERLQLQKAQQLKLTIEDAQLKQTIANILLHEQLTQAALEEKLSNAALSFEDFKQDVRRQLLLQELRQQELLPQIHISTADMQAFWQSLPGQELAEAEYHVAHILLAVNQLSSAKALAQELQKGANFGSMAKARSLGQQASQGGDLGWHKLSELPSIFARYLPSMQPQQVLGPIVDDNNLHIIKLLGKRSKPIDQELEHKALEIVREQKFQQLSEIWIKRLRSEAHIKVISE